MWKHKLQEALDGMDNLPRVIKEARGKLNEAVCFYLGEVLNFDNITTPLIKNKKEVLCGSDFRMPYDVCLYEAVVPSNINVDCRSVALIYNNTDHNDFYTVVTFVFYGNKMKEFVYSELYGEFYLNQELMTVKLCEDDTNFDISPDDNISAFSVGCSIAHVALMLLSCKNITATTISAPARLNKKRALRNNFPISEYKILEVSPSASRRVVGNNQNVLPKGLVRVHLCRGHFKEYTEENPLFGKAVGRYWWQPMVRGEKRRGMINKDYAIAG